MTIRDCPAAVIGNESCILALTEFGWEAAASSLEPVSPEDLPGNSYRVAVFHECSLGRGSMNLRDIFPTALDCAHANLAQEESNVDRDH